MSDYSHDFPLADGITYLNHAAVAPWPRRTAAAVARFAAENSTHGAQHYPDWLKVEHRLRTRLAQLLNAGSPDDIALLKNTSEGLSLVAHGLPWSAGDNLVGIRDDFPSNRVVWESLDRYGVRFRGVDINAAADPEQALLDACDRDTRLLAVSSVHYATGLRLDLERLGRHCRARGILFCIDAIQSLGVVPLDVQAARADFVAADGHKWLLGPEGLAVFYCRPALRERLTLHQFGWHMLADRGDYERPDWTPSPSATRFECGSPNMLGIHGLDASLDLLLTVGAERVLREVMNITSYLIDEIRKLPAYALRSPIPPERRAGIVSVRPLRQDPSHCHAALMARGVICAARAGGVRLSPHFHTRKVDIDHAIAIMAELSNIL